MKFSRNLQNPRLAKIRNRLACISSGAFLIAFSMSAAAMPVNGGFETGTLAGWSSSGDVSIQTAAFGTAPNSGSFQALLTTRSTDQGLEPESPFSGVNAVSAKSLESFISRPAGSLTALSASIPGSGAEAAIQGSAIQTTFSATAGETLSFAFNFLTDEDDLDANDFAFVSLTAAGGDDVFAALADVFSTTSPVSPNNPSASFSRETGFSLFSHTFGAGGIYTLSIGITDVGDVAIGSGLLIDDVAVETAELSGPGSAAFIAAVFGLLVKRRRRR